MRIHRSERKEQITRKEWLTMSSDCLRSRLRSKLLGMVVLND